jgi:hypothetical protein
MSEVSKTSYKLSGPVGVSYALFALLSLKKICFGGAPCLSVLRRAS